MKHLLLIFTLSTLLYNVSHSQTDTVNSISEQIKNDRDDQLKELNEKLKKNEKEIEILTEKLASTDNKKIEDKEKISNLEKLQLAHDNRLKIIEDTPRTKINLNGQLAFTELLSIQKDIQPADLFLISQTFFTQLSDITKIQQYSSFTSWKTEYDNWYTLQDKNDQMLQLVNSSINLISDATNKIPLYGAVIQTASSGIIAIVTSLGKKHRDLVSKTPSMLKLLNATSQFESQKSIIDHEWGLINKELGQLQKENTTLLKEQLDYYKIDSDDYTDYLKSTLDSDKDKFKNACRKTISEKLSSFETKQETKGKWFGQVEIYMYKVQSLRLRFGQLTSRMLSNIERYEHLISIYSNNANFPPEFIVKLNEPGASLKSVRSKFNSAFNPAKYVEDSAVMYIERE